MVLYCISLSSFSQINNVGELQQQMAIPTLSYTEITEKGDSIYENDSLLEMGKKAYYRWKYRTEGRTAFPGVTPTSTASDLNAYLTGTDYYSFCNMGPATAPWSEVGPDPAPGMKQAIGLISCVAADPNNHNIIYAGTIESGLWKTTNGGQSWSNIIENSNVGTIAGMGYSSIAIDPNNSNNLLVGTVTHAFEIPSDWASTSNGFGILKSTDGGQSWTVGTCAAINNQQWFVKKVKYHPINSSVAIAAGNKTIFKTTDGGLNWNIVFTNPTGKNSVFIDVEFNLNAPHYVMASTRFTQVGYTTKSPHAAQIFGSAATGNNGSWTEVTLPTNQTDTSWAASMPMDVTLADPGYVYTFFSNFWGKYPDGKPRVTEHMQLYKTADAGQTWILVNDKLTRRSSHTAANLNYGAVQYEFELSDNDPSILYIGGYYVAKSTNQGSYFDIGTYQYFPDQHTHADVRDIYNLGYINGEDHLLVANDGGVSLTTNSAASYSNLNGTGLGVTQFYGFDVFRSSPETVMGGAIHNAIAVKKEGNWQLFNDLGDGDWSEIDHLSEDESVCYIVINGKVKRKTNYGLSDAGMANQLGQRYFYRGQKLYIDPHDHNRVFHLIHNLYAYDRSTNAWSEFFHKPQNGTGGSSVISAFAIAPSNPDRMYIAYNNISYGDPVHNKFLRSFNGGNSWADATDDVSYGGGGSVYHWSYISDIAVDPEDEDNVFISLKNYSKDAANPTQGTYRVYHSTDGGISWTDMSTGLKPIPVNDLEYVAGTDDLLFAATDGGVYYWDKPNQTWKCFNNGMPNSMVINLEHDRCTQTLYASTLGRGIWKAPLTDFVRPQHHIHELVSWDSDRFMDGDVIVENGATLTVRAKIHMGRDARIIIEGGGHLIVEDSGTLTSGNCNASWGGIWIEGNSLFAQTLNSPQQGHLDLRPGSTIEYAEQAITNSLPPSGNDWVVWGTQGGIIEADGCTFRNNTRDAAIVSYSNPHNNGVYWAEFKDCTFERDDNYRNSSLMAHISMLSVEGVSIEGCQFTHTITSGPFKENGEGIFALNATFSINSSSSQNSSFTGYRDAVRAQNVLCALTTNPIEINNTVFTHNYHSIYLSEAQYAKVSHNTVNVLNAEERTSQNPTAFQSIRYGIYMDGCQDFELYENTLATGSQNSFIESAGMILKNTGAVATEIYRNQIDGFTVGMEAIGRNRDASVTDVGLTFKCNDFGSNAGNAYDIFIAEAASHPENGIQVFQGQNTNQTFPEDLMNNLFTSNGNPFTSNFQNNENSSIIYFYGKGSGRLEPRQIIGISAIGSLLNVDYLLHCPERSIAPPGDLSSPTQGYTQAEGDLANGLSLRTQYIDNGATPALEAQILIADDQQEYQDLYIDLMNTAPYVSEENLLNVAEISDYPELALRNIMVANPHASRNSEIMEALWNKEPALSQQTLDDIEAGEQTITSKDILDMQVMDAQSRSEIATRKILAYYRSTGEDELDNMISHLLSTDEPHFHYSVVDALIAAGDAAGAQTVLDDIPNVCPMSDAVWNDYNEMSDLYSILISVNGSNPVDLDSELKSDLENLAQNDAHLAAGRARNLLALYNEPTDYFEPVYIPGISGKKSEDPIPDRPEIAESGFSLSPNPAEDYTILQWDWLKAGLSEPIAIQIYDLKGSLVYHEKVEQFEKNIEIISSKNFIQGSYLIKVLHKGETVFNSKLMVK